MLSAITSIIRRVCLRLQVALTFSSLVDAYKRDALSSAEVWLTQSESDSLARSLYLTLEMHSFMEWTLGVIGKQISLAQSEHASPALDKAYDYLGVLDKSVGDSLGEVATMFANLSLKKRDLFVGSLTKSFVDRQKASLLFGPLSKDGLFDDSLLYSFSADLLGRDTHDAVSSFARSLRSVLGKRKATPSSSTSQTSRFLPGTSRPSFRRSGGARKKKGRTRPSRKTTDTGK